MNNRTSFALLAVLTAVGTLTMSSAYADQHQSTMHMEEKQNLPPACVQCDPENAKTSANTSLMKSIPISVWTDKAEYGHNDMIRVMGQVANTASGFSVTVTVVSPINSIVTIDQVSVAEDGSFETMLNTTVPPVMLYGIHLPFAVISFTPHVVVLGVVGFTIASPPINSTWTLLLFSALP